MTLSPKKMVIIDPEKLVQREIKNSRHFVFRIEVEARDRERDTFLVLKSSTMNCFADTLIEEALAMGNLRVVFVVMDTNADVFFDKVQELDSPELLQKLFRVSSVEQINRILQAWCERRAALSVARAYVEGDDLVVQACDLKRYRIKFADYVGLASLSMQQREQFQIDEVGNHLHWPELDISIDIDAIRYQLDDEFRQARDKDALYDYKEFLGLAVREVMAKYQLTQSSIKERGGPAERHLYRIEQGEQELTPAMIDRLSKAHGLSSQKYVLELIAACDDIAEREAEAMSGG